MELLQELFLRILNMSITASYIIVIILFIRLCIRKAPKVYSYLLWGVVGFRLLCPVSFSSLLSVLNFNIVKNRAIEYKNGTIEYFISQENAMTVPSVTTGISSSKNIINSNLPAANTVTSVDPGQVLLYIATLLWIAGFIAFLIYNCITYIRLRQRVSKAVLFRENIYECDKIPSPFILGSLKPNIYIPFRLQERELNYILMHEQYHIKRLDHIIKPLSFLLVSIYWFNPFIWAAYFYMCKDMEMSCDEKVLNDMGATVVKDYSMSLLSFAANRRFPIAGPLAFGEMNVKARIKNVLQYKKPKLWFSLLIGLICLLVVLSCAANPYQKTVNQDQQSNTGNVTGTADTSEYANTLYDMKNPYIGNASANGKILNNLGVSTKLGGFTVEMETSEKPYVLRLNFNDEVIDRDTFDSQMFPYATLLLALIENADEIQWSYPSTADGEMARYTVYWNQQNLDVMGLDDIKSYGESPSKIQELLDFLDNYNADISFSYADNVTDNEDGSPQDKNTLTMNDVLSQNSWNNLTLDYFKSFANAVTQDVEDENALNAYLIFTLQYGDDTYQLQVSYLKEDNSIDSILLLKQSDSDAILLYSDNPNYKVNTDVKSFLKKKISMDQYLTYTLPNPLVNGSYNASLGYGGGNLFLMDGEMPEGPETAPIEWYVPGGVLRLTYEDTGENMEAESDYFVTFENGKLISGNLHENHSAYIGNPLILDNLQEQAVIMEVSHDLYTASDIAQAEESGSPIPQEEQTSTMYEIYFARENSNTAYCIFLNEKYFNLEDAKALANSVQFKEGAFN